MAPTHKRKLSDGDGVLDAPTDAPPKRQKGHVCHTCEDFKANNQFPLLHDPGHEHDRNTCRGCYRDWLLIQLETEKWDEIQCPECELQLSMKAMSKILNAVEYRRYERTALVTTLSEFPDFTWCTASNCNSGQIHLPNPSQSCDPVIFTCAACDHAHCIMCKRDWHQSLSCDEAASEDAKRRREEDKESEKMVGKVSKPCPGCGVKIEKDGGCVNMHCVKCGCGFCWACMGKYNVASGEYHLDGCRER